MIHLRPSPRSLNGEHITFKCPLEYLTTTPGFTFASDGWHPSEALREYGTKQTVEYRGSLLQIYYRRHRPENAAEARPGFDQVPQQFYGIPSVCCVAPWSSETVEEKDRRIRRIFDRDNKEHSKPELTVASDGSPLHDPGSEPKGELEYHRLTNVYHSLEANGCKRSHGHVGVGVLKRDSEHRFLLQGAGFHRTAAAAALGMRAIPSRFAQPPIIDADMIGHWSQVRRGLWSKRQAIKYVDHLLGFDSQAWARKQGLVHGRHLQKVGARDDHRGVRV